MNLWFLGKAIAQDLVARQQGYMQESYEYYYFMNRMHVLINKCQW